MQTLKKLVITMPQHFLKNDVHACSPLCALALFIINWAPLIETLSKFCIFRTFLIETLVYIHLQAGPALER